MSAQERTMNGTEFSDETIARIAFAVRGQMQTGDETLTKEEVATKYFKITVKTMERRFKRGHYPTSLIHRDGSTVLFLKSEIINYVKKL